MSEKKNSKWQTLEKEAKAEIKFLPKTDNITIYSDEPYEKEIDGKYGKQKMYIVNTSIGLVALNRAQFLQVAAAFAANDYKMSIRFSR